MEPLITTLLFNIAVVIIGITWITICISCLSYKATWFIYRKIEQFVKFIVGLFGGWVLYIIKVKIFNTTYTTIALIFTA